MKTCRSKLAEYYKHSGTVPISVWSTLDPVEIHEIYTRLSWEKQEQNAAGSSQTELDHYGDLFAANESRTFPKRILVQGQTGIGKTTFVKKLALDWAELNLEDETADDKKAVALKKFELLVAVNLKEVSKHQSLKDVLSYSNIFAEEDKSMTDGLLKYITDNQDKVLLVFDGYDEYRCGRDSDIFKIFKGDKLRDCCVLITSRISKADDLRESGVLKVLRAEILGFSHSGIFSYMERKLGSDKDAEELFAHLLQKRLLALAESPLLLLFFCILWKEGNLESWPETKTDLYVQMVQSVLDHNQAKHSASASCEFPEVIDFKEILCELGKVALDSLLIDDHVFDYKQLHPSIFSEESSFIGLLQVTKHIGNRRPAGMVSFTHKSIQEFLSAWYITYRLIISEGNIAPLFKEHIRTLESCFVFENVLEFVCGLSDKGAVTVFEHLKSVRTSDPSVDLTSTVPDLENGKDEPLCEVSKRHERFYGFVLNLFQEVQSKGELSRNCLDCVGNVLLDFHPFTEALRLENCNSWFFRVTIPASTYPYSFFPSVNHLFETLKCLDLKNKNSGFLKIDDFIKRFRKVKCGLHGLCHFSSLFRYHFGKVHIFITEFEFLCLNHAKVLIEAGGITVFSDFSTLCSSTLSLKFLTHVKFFDCIDKSNVEEYCTIFRNCGKNLNSIELCTRNENFVSYSNSTDDWLVRLLKELPTPPEKCSLKIGIVDFDSVPVNYRLLPDFSLASSYLTSGAAEQLACLLPKFKNTRTLYLNFASCLSPAAEKLVESITHEQLQHLLLQKLSLTPALVAALGQSLPKLTSLQTLKLGGVKSRNILDAELLFGFCKLAFLKRLHLSCFNMRKNFTKFVHSLHFSPNLRELDLQELSLSGSDLCSLLESVRHHNPTLTVLGLQGIPLSDSVTSIVQHIKNLPTLKSLWINQEDLSEEGWKSFMAALETRPQLYINRLKKT